MIKFGCEVHITLINEEDSNVCVGSVIIWFKPNCNGIFSIALPSFAVMSFSQQLLDFTLKSPKSNTKKWLFCTPDSRFSSRIF